MKRKTNLFYQEGIDSNFVTFSNYGENLTGNFLTTNTKLFPSKFICLQSNKLANNFSVYKPQIIQALTTYYENKLAFLRDNVEPSDRATTINPLGYLIETLATYTDAKVRYIGTISEQDYDGTYTDLICTIGNEKASAEYTTTVNHGTETKECEDTKTLYGWTADDITTVYGKGNSYSPKFDADTKYYTTSTSCITASSTTTDGELKFNIIVPLYDYVDIDYEYTVTTTTDDLTGSYTKNVPYGMYFSEHLVTLNYDSVTKTRPSWSISFGTQFKVFPYTKDTSTVQSQSDIESEKSALKATYAEILIRQSSIMDAIQSQSVLIQNLAQRVKQLEGQISLVGGDVDVNNIFTRLDSIESKYKTLYNAVAEIDDSNLVVSSTED